MQTLKYLDHTCFNFENGRIVSVSYPFGGSDDNHEDVMKSLKRRANQILIDGGFKDFTLSEPKLKKLNVLYQEYYIDVTYPEVITSVNSQLRQKLDLLIASLEFASKNDDEFQKWLNFHTFSNMPPEYGNLENINKLKQQIIDISFLIF